jgi:hypothetical protein
MEARRTLSLKRDVLHVLRSNMLCMYFGVVVGPKDTAPEEVFKVTFQDYEKYLPYLYGTLKKEVSK